MFVDHETSQVGYNVTVVLPAHYQSFIFLLSVDPLQAQHNLDSWQLWSYLLHVHVAQQVYQGARHDPLMANTTCLACLVRPGAQHNPPVANSCAGYCVHPGA